MEFPSFLRWLRQQPRAAQHKHLRAMLREGNATIAQVAREYHRLWHDEEK